MPNLNRKNNPQLCVLSEQMGCDSERTLDGEAIPNVNGGPRTGHGILDDPTFVGS